jgi:hypothetical protein
MPYVNKITRKEEEDIRILIRHALEDMDYGAGGTYNVITDDPSEEVTDKHSIDRAKRGIATIARLLESLKN